MATGITFASSVVVVILGLVLRNNVAMASHSLQDSVDWNCNQESFYSKRLVARDVIQQTIHDVQSLEKFVNAIPKLKSFGETTGQSPEVKDCVEGLVGHMKVARQTLSMIRHLNEKAMPVVLTKSKLLQDVMNEAVELQGQVCHIALKDVDRTITSMLSRKLLEVAVTIDEVVYLVYKLQLHIPDHN
ncbi:hypothetical protein ACET3Z_004148 [Daucus carota]